ncbi:hypothetical protein CBER1_11491 [Cercospora berteroae]|uniref:Major facilitator superfamily (MFS) profile domain-containing protein n=1 Tax=Cercospora berteroae TaxID=357750 RepID=A0A2S6BZQ2_9PEZI|nr:hypothetical protein CBER1_11491 [Cercospora berteroae]
MDSEKDNEQAATRGRPVEQVEEAQIDDDDDRSSRSVARQRTNASRTSSALAPPLRLARSQSSARSQRSYHLQDGYTFHQDDDETAHSTKEAERSPSGDKDFEVRFDGDEDPYSPKNLPTWRKWIIVLIVSASSLCVTCASAMYTSTYRQLEVDFHVSRLGATVGLTTFVCGLGLGPMFLSPLSEFYGRRIIYICAFGMYLIWLIPCAVAPNIATMLVARFLDGLAGSAFLSVAGGTVGDMFRKDQLSAPMMIYTASPFVGPEVGPVVGGFINQFADWRWTFYVLIIWAALQWILIVVFVPETYAPVLLRRKAQKLRKETGDQRWKAPIEVMDRSVLQTVLWSCIRPFQLLFFEQMCLNLCLLSAILLGILYLFFGAFAVVFQNNHNFNQWQTGLTFLGIFVGMIAGVSCDPLWRKRYIRLVEQNGGVSEPEFRLPPTILGAVIVPLSLFGFGWTTYSHVHWIVPIMFSAFFGLGNIFCFSGIFTFLVETYPLYAASALAANSFARSSFAAGFPLFGVQMYEKLGYQWASSLLAFIALAMTPFPFLFFKIGKRLRANSKFANPG